MEANGISPPYQDNKQKEYCIPGGISEISVLTKDLRKQRHGDTFPIPIELACKPVQKASLFYRMTLEYCKPHEEVMSVSAAVQNKASPLRVTSRALASLMQPLGWQILHL